MTRFSAEDPACVYLQMSGLARTPVMMRQTASVAVSARTAVSSNVLPKLESACAAALTVTVTVGTAVQSTSDGMTNSREYESLRDGGCSESGQDDAPQKGCTNLASSLDAISTQRRRCCGMSARERGRRRGESVQESWSRERSAGRVRVLGRTARRARGMSVFSRTFFRDVHARGSGPGTAGFAALGPLEHLPKRRRAPRKVPHPFWAQARSQVRFPGHRIQCCTLLRRRSVARERRDCEPE